MKRYHKRAFSIIELSIVILVIGILVAGITKSVGMIKKFRISTARTLTLSSPVNSIEGLELWLEPTKEESFLAEETEDGVDLSQWNDINPQKPFKYHALKTATSEVKYEDNAIGNLPSLKFSGTPSGNSYLTLSRTTSPSDNTLIILDGMANLTFFVVAQVNSSSSGHRPVFYNGIANTTDLIGWGYELNNEHPIFVGALGQSITSTHNTLKSVPEIISFTIATSEMSDYFSYECGQAGSFKFYVNGAISDNGNSLIGVCTVSDLGVMRIGGFRNPSIGGFGAENDTAWDGYISEIIIFSRVLRKKERRSVEEYLSQKYNIRLTS